MATLEALDSYTSGDVGHPLTLLYLNTQCQLAGSFILVSVISTTSRAPTIAVYARCVPSDLTHRCTVFVILGKRSIRMEQARLLLRILECSHQRIHSPSSLLRQFMRVDSTQPLAHGLMVGCTLGTPRAADRRQSKQSQP